MPSFSYADKKRFFENALHALNALTKSTGQTWKEESRTSEVYTILDVFTNETEKSAVEDFLDSHGLNELFPRATKEENSATKELKITPASQTSTAPDEDYQTKKVSIKFYLSDMPTIAAIANNIFTAPHIYREEKALILTVLNKMSQNLLSSGPVSTSSIKAQWSFDQNRFFPSISITFEATNEGISDYEKVEQNLNDLFSHSDSYNEEKKFIAAITSSTPPKTNDENPFLTPTNGNLTISGPFALQGVLSIIAKQKALIAAAAASKSSEASSGAAASLFSVDKSLACPWARNAVAEVEAEAEAEAVTIAAAKAVAIVNVATAARHEAAAAAAIQLIASIAAPCILDLKQAQNIEAIQTAVKNIGSSNSSASADDKFSALHLISQQIQNETLNLTVTQPKSFFSLFSCCCPSEKFNKTAADAIKSKIKELTPDLSSANKAAAEKIVGTSGSNLVELKERETKRSPQAEM